MKNQPGESTLTVVPGQLIEISIMNIDCEIKLPTAWPIVYIEPA